MKKMTSALLFLASINASCSDGEQQLSQTKDTPTAENRNTSVSALDPGVVGFVDVSKYVGLWFEIAAIPQSFQRFCQSTTAEYAILSPTQISVANRCKVGIAPFSIFGTATVTDTKTNAILEVAFKNVERKGDYRIVALAEDYSHAMVTDKTRSTLFVLSRTKTLDDSVYESLLKRAESIGVDVSKVKKTKQND